MHPYVLSSVPIVLYRRHRRAGLVQIESRHKDGWTPCTEPIYLSIIYSLGLVTRGEILRRGVLSLGSTRRTHGGRKRRKVEGQAPVEQEKREAREGQTVNLKQQGLTPLIDLPITLLPQSNLLG
jgi:hypothetical protein